MKRIILVSAVVLLAACGSTKTGVSVSTATDQTSAPDTVVPATDTAETTAGSDDTINVDNFGDMPKQCVELFTSFLKQIEPDVSAIDWEKATLADFEAFGTQFQAESDAFDAQRTAAGCDKYNFNDSDEEVFKQLTDVAAAEAPGTLAFLAFLNALSADSTADSGSVPTDCTGTIAAIEPFLGTGKTMQDLTIAEVTRLGGLVTAVTTNCTTEEAAAFFDRDDVTTFIGD
jgi:hypothetical protein